MNRLNPKKNSGRYHILVNLKKAIECIIKKEETFGNIIDYGAKDSPYKSLFERKSHSFQTADIGDSSDCDIQLNNDGTIPVTENTFDTVLSSQVLEHVNDVNLYLSETKRVLKKNGRLILSTHGYWKYHPDPTDFWRWTQDGLIKILNENGFEVLENYGVMGLSATGLQLFQDGIRDKIPSWVRGIFFKVIAYFQSKLDRNRIDYRDASVYVIFAKIK